MNCSNIADLSQLLVFSAIEQAFYLTLLQDFNSHQQASFCVYSGHGVAALRNHLNAQFFANQAGSDDASTRRGSGSSTSSITVPGGSSPPPPISTRQLNDLQISPATFPAYRRGSAPASRDGNSHLGSAFASATPNFLTPSTSSMPGSYHSSRSARGSRESSASPIPDTEERPRPAGPRNPFTANRASTGNIYARTYMASMLPVGDRDRNEENATRLNGRGSGGWNEARFEEATRMRRVSEITPSSPLRWVADVVGWRAEEGPRGERR